MTSPISILLKKGVRIPNPDSVEIGPDVDPDRISGDQVVIHSGCKLFGKKTLVLARSRLGYEAPVTVNDCQLGPNVHLKGGFFEKSVFLGDNQMGLGAHVRAGSIFEEQANGAHTVAVKQTILFPFVTLGSLINFCDCLMAGGTSRKDHSEVGSAYIHFNYTPNQDKATASLIGDVPRGVMLDQPPIFLGGQGGLVGPCRIDFGNIIAAGSIYRKDVTDPGNLLIGSQGRGGRIPFRKGVYPSIKRIVVNNFIYVANLIALMQWYRHVRSSFISNGFPQTLFKGLVETLTLAIGERMSRIDQLISLLPKSLKMLIQGTGDNFASANIRHHQALVDKQNLIMDTLDRCRQSAEGDEAIRDQFLRLLAPLAEKTNYIQTIRMLDSDVKGVGSQWLTSVVDEVFRQLIGHVPSFEMNALAKGRK